MIKPPSCVSFVVLVFSLLATAASAALNAPTGLAVTNLKATSFTLTWTAATGGTGGIAGYDIYRDGSLVGSTTTRSFAVTNLSPLTTYGMTVTARDGAGAVSVPSPTLAVATLADTVVPTRPADLAAANVTTSSCTLNWTGSTDNVGVTGYTVYRSGVLIGTSITTTFDVTGLAPDTNNNLTVRATDAAGNLSAASVALAVRTLALPPSVPTGLATANLKATAFTLTWAASTGGTGGIASYDVFQNGALVGAAISGRTFVVSGLSPNTTYSMAALSRDAAGNISPASAVLDVTTPADTTGPTRPADLVAESITTTSFSLTWTGSTDNVGVTGYNIYRSGVLLGSTAATTYQVSGLVPDSTNTITVRAMDAAGNLSTASVALSVRMVALPPSAPTTLMTTNLKPASFKLTWTTSRGGIGGIAGYDVYLNGSLVGSPVTRSLAITGLVPMANYTMTVVSRDSISNLSGLSDSLLVTTPADTTKPTVPKGLSAADVTASSFTLTWTASTDNVGVEGYDVFRNDVFIGATQVASFNVTGLSASTLSSMRLKARDATGNISGFSAILPVTTSAPPNLPPVIALTVPTDGSTFTLPFALTLSSAATDNDGTITKVEFFDNGTLLGETTTPASPNTFTFPITFTSSGVHSLSARATDNRNATTDSTPVSITLNNPNLSPTILLSAPATGAAPAFLTLSAEVTDSDGAISKVEFYEGTVLLGELLAPTTNPSNFTFPLTLYSAGTYTITAVATDNSGAQSASEPVVITVNSGAAALPFVANFEQSEGFQLGPLSGQLSWFATGGVAVVPSMTPTPGSQQELSIPAAEPGGIISHDFSAPGVSPVFVDFQANPVAGSDPSTAVMFSTPAAQVALVGTSSPATLWIFGGSGQGWYATSQKVPVDPAGRSVARLRLTTREDYLTKKWDLYLNSQMIAADVAFADSNATALTDFSVNGHATATSAFDSFYAGPENPLFADANHNGIDDTWETTHGLSLANDNRSFSPTGNGVTVLNSYLNGSDPNDFYSGTIPTLSIVSGDDQTSAPGLFNAQPLVISVKNAAGTAPLGNAPVTFVVQSGGGQLALFNTGTPQLSSTLNLTTDENGIAQLYYQQPGTAGTISQICAAAGGAQVLFQSTSLQNQLPVVTLTAPATGDSFSAPTAMLLQATASDPDGTIAKVEFFQGTTKLGEALSAPFEFHWVNVGVGSYTLTARATDDRNAQTVSSAVVVQVNPVILAPVVELLDPENGLTLLQGSAVTLRAQGYELDGRLAKIEFFADGALFATQTFASGVDTTLPVTAVWNATGLGSHTFVARAYDLAGASAASAPATIQVATSPPPAVSLTAPANNSRFDLGVAIIFRASASGGVGGIAKVEYYSDGLLLGSATVSPYQLSVSNLGVGTHRLRARVYDAAGGVGISSVVRTITILPRVPYAVDFTAAEGFSPGLQRGLLGWNATVGAAWVANVGDASGSRALILRATTASAPTLSQNFTPVSVSAENPIFIDMVVRLPAGDSASTAPVISFGNSLAALVKDNGVGRVYVRDSDGESGRGWIASDSIVGLGSDGTTSDWFRITARLSNNRWDASVNGRLVGFSLRTTTTDFYQMSLTGSNNADLWLDRLSVGYVNPLFEDLDCDGMDDAWETAHGLNRALNDRDLDLDADGLSNIQEFSLGTKPDSGDTDGDGIPDNEELSLGTNPTNGDSDGDGMPDAWERNHSLNPLSSADAAGDPDGNGLSNLQEYTQSLTTPDYYAGIIPVIESLQDLSGEVSSDGAISVLVRSIAGQALNGAPVIFTASEGGHLLSATPGGVGSTSVRVTSNALGLARAYVVPNP